MHSLSQVCLCWSLQIFAMREAELQTRRWEATLPGASGDRSPRLPDSPALEVVQVQLPHVVRGGGHGHHPGAAARGARLPQGVQEEVGQ